MSTEGNPLHIWGTTYLTEYPPIEGLVRPRAIDDVWQLKFRCRYMIRDGDSAFESVYYGEGSLWGTCQVADFTLEDQAWIRQNVPYAPELNESEPPKLCVTVDSIILSE